MNCDTKTPKPSSRRQSVTAIVYDRRGRVLSVGHNSYKKTHPEMARWARLAGEPYRIYLHAETAALAKCRGVPYRIRIQRFDYLGRPVLAKPCRVCSLAIRESGIKVVEFTCTDGWTVVEL